MLTRLFTTVVVMLGVYTATACDVCGCASNSISNGVLTSFNAHSFGLGYSVDRFESSHPTLFSDEIPIVSKEGFVSANVQFQVYPWRSFNLGGALPYHRFTRTEEGEAFQTRGLGDAQLYSQYVLTKGDSSSRLRHRSTFTGGVKLPTGTADLRDEFGALVNPNLQMGTGSWDLFFGAGHLIQANQWGLASDIRYRINSRNWRAYRFGNRASAKVTLMRWVKLNGSGDLWLRPAIGMEVGHMASDFENVLRKELNPYSGGFKAQLTFQLTARIKNLLVQGAYRAPIIQNMSDGLIQALPALNIQLNYLIQTQQ